MFEEVRYETFGNPVFRGNQPIFSSFRAQKNLTPYGVRNNKSYVTVIMPPFEAKLIKINTTTRGNKVFKQLIFQFLKFTSSNNRTLGRLRNPQALQELLRIRDILRNNKINSENETQFHDRQLEEIQKQMKAIQDYGFGKNIYI